MEWSVGAPASRRAVDTDRINFVRRKYERAPWTRTALRTAAKNNGRAEPRTPAGADYAVVSKRTGRQVPHPPGAFGDNLAPQARKVSG